MFGRSSDQQVYDTSHNGEKVQWARKVKSTMVGLLPPLLRISEGLRPFPKPSRQCVKSDLYDFFNSLFSAIYWIAMHHWRICLKTKSYMPLKQQNFSEYFLAAPMYKAPPSAFGWKKFRSFQKPSRCAWITCRQCRGNTPAKPESGGRLRSRSGGPVAKKARWKTLDLSATLVNSWPSSVEAFFFFLAYP